MKDKLDKLAEEERSVRLRRHQAQCSICQHPQRQEIEDAWTPPCLPKIMMSAGMLCIAT